MEPATVVGYLAKPAASRLVAHINKALNRNDDQLRREREELSLQWSAEVRGALPQIVGYLESRIDDLDGKLARVFGDPQFGRIFTNFTFEAAREAIDERRAMLAHVAIGIVDPDISVERKARVERTLRLLDPEDLLTLHGLKLVPGYLGSEQLESTRAKICKDRPSADVLISAGCLRTVVLGGGYGQSPFPGIVLTQLGEDILRCSRTFTVTRHPPFDVPGREVKPGDRSEDQARATLAQIPGLSEFVLWTVRRTLQMLKIYKRQDKSGTTHGTLTLYVHEWVDWKPRLQSLSEKSQALGIDVTLTPQPFSPENGGAPYDILRVELSGPHDLVRYWADDCEAIWA